MIKTTLLIAALMLGAASAVAQASSHEVDLSWASSSDAASDPASTVSVFRAPGACPTTGIPTGAKLLTSSAPASGPYKDTAVTSGTWCYYVTATVLGVQSGPSTDAGVSVPTAAPTGLTTVVVK